MTQAFVYKWIHQPTGMWYIGSRTAKGCHTDDGYICSSTIVKPMIEEKPHEWKRTILETGTPQDMRKLESRLLRELNAKNNLMSFNRNNADGPPKKVRTVSELRKNIMPTTPMNDNQSLAKEEKPKKKGRGGARPNSGRKVGSTVKLSAQTLLAAIADVDVPFEQGLAEDYHKARLSGDLHVIQKYQTMILSKVVADKQELDVTSNGQTLGASFSFPTLELPEWNNDPTKH
jgi:hypothetical protein